MFIDFCLLFAALSAATPNTERFLPEWQHPAHSFAFSFSICIQPRRVTVTRKSQQRLDLVYPSVFLSHSISLTPFSHLPLPPLISTKTYETQWKNERKKWNAAQKKKRMKNNNGKIYRKRRQKANYAQTKVFVFIPLCAICAVLNVECNPFTAGILYHLAMLLLAVLICFSLVSLAFSLLSLSLFHGSAYDPHSLSRSLVADNFFSSSCSATVEGSHTLWFVFTFERYAFMHLYTRHRYRQRF